MPPAVHSSTAAVNLLKDQHSQGSKADAAQKLGSDVAEAAEQQPCDKSGLKSVRGAASTSSTAATSDDWSRPLSPWNKVSPDSSNSIAASANGSAHLMSGKQDLPSPAHAQPSSHEQPHGSSQGSAPLPRRGRVSRWDSADPVHRRSHMLPGKSIGSRQSQSQDTTRYGSSCYCHYCLQFDALLHFAA